jgi:hypothetical protein
MQTLKGVELIDHPLKIEHYDLAVKSNKYC